MSTTSNQWITVFMALVAGLIGSFLCYQFYASLSFDFRSEHRLILSLAGMAFIGFCVGVAAGYSAKSFPTVAILPSILLLGGQNRFPEFLGSIFQTSVNMICGVGALFIGLLLSRAFFNSGEETD